MKVDNIHKNPQEAEQNNFSLSALNSVLCLILTHDNSPQFKNIVKVNGPIAAWDSCAGAKR